MNIAVIFAGGTGKRINSRSVPKQFLEVHGKPVLVYTLEKFNAHSRIDKIVLVCVEPWISQALRLISKYHLDKVITVIPGGDSGQNSIFLGISKAKELSIDDRDIVLIHDGVRPMIDEDTISTCLDCASKNGNAITTAPATETIFISDRNGNVDDILNRSRCLMARAPQCFYLKDIYSAHLKANSEGRDDFIDSAMMMKHYGAELHTVPGPVENIKITTATDFYLFRALLDAQESMQIAGF